MAESRQHTIDRIRRPRVHITYDVEIGNAIGKKELPFVVGVLADLSGMPVSTLPSMKFRKFVDVDRDNLSEIMRVISPRLVIRVPNHLSEDVPATSIELNFERMEDFEPQNLAQKVPVLASLYKKRNNLRNLITKMDGNEALEELLNQIMKNRDNLDKLKREIDERKFQQMESSEKEAAGKKTTGNKTPEQVVDETSR